MSLPVMGIASSSKTAIVRNVKMNSALHHPCPICNEVFTEFQIESHISKCIAVSSTPISLQRHKRKRSPSPTYPLDVLKSAEDNGSSCATTVSGNIRFKVPLTDMLRPKSLQDFMGQTEVLGENTYVRSLLNQSEIPSIILWGPPGCGKTSLANILGEICRKNRHQYKFLSICGTNCSIKIVQSIIDEAKELMKSRRKMVVFVDEIHRLSRKQQNIFLVQVAAGLITLVGATTENPSFIFTDSFLNYCKVIVMEKLDSSCLVSIIERALALLKINIMEDENILQNLYLNNRRYIHKSAIKWLSDTSDGDARIALNNLQLAMQHNKDNQLITIANIKDQIKKAHVMYDRNGEEHYNIISAMHESIKGYNDNAALYWITRMITGGEDYLYLARRLVRCASEDVGNANPRALRFAISTMYGVQELAMSEPDVLLAQCAVYLARSPTNHESITGLKLAKQMIQQCQQQPAVPLHLQNGPPKLIDELGIQKTASLSFMPKGFENVNFL